MEVDDRAEFDLEKVGLSGGRRRLWLHVVFPVFASTYTLYRTKTAPQFTYILLPINGLQRMLEPTGYRS